MWRAFVSIVAGLMTAGLAIAGIESIAQALWPPPEGFDPTDPDQLDALVMAMPMAAKLIVTAGFGLGPLLGAVLGGYLSQERELRVAVGVGVVMEGMTLLNLSAIAHPVWMTVAAAAVPLPCALAGGWIARRLNQREDGAGAAA
ncbi:MAG: hypothetical protein H6733_01935 [Alphaproteobacteria bacterium]|nr:hypothetical protein [Alphaproteobacteria bacterium]